jgi:hypothetical protein
MIYSPKRLKQPERLAEGEYRGLTYYVLTLGTHPCAYVDVTGTLLDGKGYDDIDIFCHFGLTYAEPHLSTVDTGGWFIGWDYGHYSDFAGYTLEMPLKMQTGKKWTTEEMVEECKNVIDQIIDEGFANRKQTLGEWISVEERLPEAEKEVLVFAVRRFKYGDQIHEVPVITTAFYEDGTISTEDSDWNWYDIDFIYDEENDVCYIPEGWWEYRHYNPDDVYNNAVDDKITHWMPLPEAPKMKGGAE